MEPRGRVLGKRVGQTCQVPGLCSPAPLGSPSRWPTHLQDLILEHRELIGIAGCEVVEDLDILGHGCCRFVAPA